MAQAAAGSSGMRLQSLVGAQLFSMYVGEGEALLRDAFQRARLTAPAIIFIDEIDAIVGVLLMLFLFCNTVLTMYVHTLAHGESSWAFLAI